MRTSIAGRTVAGRLSMAAAMTALALQTHVGPPYGQGTRREVRKPGSKGD